MRYHQFLRLSTYRRYGIFVITILLSYTAIQAYMNNKTIDLSIEDVEQQAIDQQEEIDRFLVVSLRENKYAVGMLCPKFEDENGIIKPSGIEKLIRWGLDSSDIKNRIFVHKDNPEVLNTLEIILNEFYK